MGGGRKILSAYGPGECLTNALLCERTGLRLKDVAAWVAHLRKKGYLRRCTAEGEVPVAHAMADMKPVRAKRYSADVMVRKARATQPTCVWDLAKEQG